MDVLYPQFPTVERPPDPVHISEPMASVSLPNGDEVITYQCADPRIIGLAYQDRERLNYGGLIVLPRESLATIIELLNHTVVHMEDGGQ